MKCDALIFDLDGTLVDSIPLYKRAFCETLAAFSVEITEEEFNRIYWENRKLPAVLERFGKAHQEPDIRRHRNDLYIKKLGAQVEWFADAVKLQQALEPALPRAIVTDSWRSFVDAIEIRTGLSSFTTTVITADDRGPLDKPHPAGLLLAAERLGVDPARCMYIGDQEFDLNAARNAGMAECLVIRKHTPPAAVRSAKRIIHSLEELLAEL